MLCSLCPTAFSQSHAFSTEAQLRNAQTALAAAQAAQQAAEARAAQAAQQAAAAASAAAPGARLRLPRPVYTCDAFTSVSRFCSSTRAHLIFYGIWRVRKCFMSLIVKCTRITMLGTGHGHAGGGVSEAEVARRVEEAAAAARAAAEAEADEGMTDLLVCLGQEERKVQVREARQRVGEGRSTARRRRFAGELRRGAGR